MLNSALTRTKFSPSAEKSRRPACPVYMASTASMHHGRLSAPTNAAAGCARRIGFFRTSFSLVANDLQAYCETLGSCFCWIQGKSEFITWPQSRHVVHLPVDACVVSSPLTSG